jgi:hypothetical protein
VTRQREVVDRVRVEGGRAAGDVEFLPPGMLCHTNSIYNRINNSNNL